MDLYRFLALVPIVAAVGLTACQASSLQEHRAAVPVPIQSPPTPLPAPAPPAPAAPASPAPANPASNSYSNTQYRFSCAIPDGFVMTHESEGPGEIMTLVPQSVTSDSTVNLSVLAARLGRMTLEQYMDLWISRHLQGTADVTHWDKFPASYGAYSGFEVAVERQYANGPFKSRIFAFARGPNAFLVNYSASADQFDLDQKVFERLLESWSFAL